MNIATTRPPLTLLLFVLQRPGGCDSTQDALQDVDDWDLTELHADWDDGDSDCPLPPLVCPVFLIFMLLSSYVLKIVSGCRISSSGVFPSAPVQKKPHQPV